MKNIIYTIIGIIVILLFDSCSTYIAPSLSAANNIGYLPRPTNADSSKSKTYISGDWINYSDQNAVLKINLGSLNISKGYNFEKFNFGFGAFGFLGVADYTNPDPSRILPISNFSKSIYGGGIRSSLGFQPKTNGKSFNFRVLNWENALSYESGKFYDLRNELYDSTPHTSGYNNTSVSPLKALYTTGLSTEGIFDIYNIKQPQKFGYRLFVGFSPALKYNFKNIEGDTNYFKNSTAVIFNIFYQINKLYGILEYNQQYYTGARVTIGYTL